MADAADEAISVEASPAAGAQTNGIELAVMNVGGEGVSSEAVEECVLCVITDETSTDWSRSRFTYSLPFSSDVKDLYTAVGTQAGMPPPHTHTRTLTSHTPSQTISRAHSHWYGRPVLKRRYH